MGTELSKLSKNYIFNEFIQLKFWNNKITTTNIKYTYIDDKTRISLDTASWNFSLCIKLDCQGRTAWGH